MDAAAEIGRDPVSKHQIQPDYRDELADAGQDCRTRLARPNYQTRTGTGEYSFSPAPVNLTAQSGENSVSAKKRQPLQLLPPKLFSINSKFSFQLTAQHIYFFTSSGLRGLFQFRLANPTQPDPTRPNPTNIANANPNPPTPADRVVPVHSCGAWS